MFMANHAKEREAHLADGTWRADRHAAKAAQGVPDDVEDSRLWALLDHWQCVFEAARVEVDENGISIQSATQTVKNPACGVMAEATKEIRALCQVLGIGALNRARLGASSSSGDEDGDVLDLPPLPKRGAHASAKA